jgi:alcohol dehydrogenase
MDLPTSFSNHLPVKIRFGEGVALTLPEVLGELGSHTVFLMVDEGIEDFNQAAATVIAKLMDSNSVVVRFNKPAGEPTFAMVDEATTALKQSGATALVALGGGSVIDTAKAARLCAQLTCTFQEFLDQRPAYREPDVALIALPTSAGTGSEVSGGAVVSNPEAGTKNGIANALMRAQYALVDPLLTYSMPKTMTANTGIDAIAQAIAGMVASCRTPIGDAIALEAISMMTPAIVAAFNNSNDAKARAAMSCGSMMAGLTMNVSDCSAEHSLGQAIGGLTHAPHGLTIGLVLAETLDRERAFVAPQLERVATAMGEPEDGTTDGSRAVRAVKRLLKNLEFPVLSDLDLDEADLDTLTELALADYFITMAPEPWSTSEVRACFANALALKSR